LLRARAQHLSHWARCADFFRRQGDSVSIRITSVLAQGHTRMARNHFWRYNGRK
jgi:hypothetical protein